MTTIDDRIADKALNALDVDHNGLDDMDIRILKAIIENYSGGPVGLSTLGVAVGEDKGTIEEVYEPFLIKEGFLQRTAKGRVATIKAYEYLGVRYTDQRDSSSDLFNPYPDGRSRCLHRRSRFSALPPAIPGSDSNVPGPHKVVKQ